MITKAFAITKLSNLSFLNQIPMKIFCEFQRQNMFKSSPHQFDCLFSKNDSRTNRSDIMWSSSVAGRTWKHFHIDMKMYDQRQTDYFCKLLVKIFSDVVEAEQSRAYMLMVNYRKHEVKRISNLPIDVSYAWRYSLVINWLTRLLLPTFSLPNIKTLRINKHRGNLIIFPTVIDGTCGKIQISIWIKEKSGK